MRSRIGSTLAALLAAGGLAAGIAGPVYAAIGADSGSATSTVQAGRAMLVGGGGSTPGKVTTQGRAM
jgi:hypothetical protein